MHEEKQTNGLPFARMIYVMGPSGAGKDSVLAWLRQHLRSDLALHFAKRTITRSAEEGNESHEAVTAEQFSALQAQGDLAIAWQANGLDYGIRHSELTSLGKGAWVLVNGSRGHLLQAQAQFPGMVMVHITADEAQLTQRLLARGRETSQQVADRLARARRFEVPAAAIQIENNQSLETAARSLLLALERLPGWPE